ncbi:hypothetical protein [Acidocella aminolytica]|uniref:hypothetical protein n=1 Tax=Acidocella aminolytica TaxID=33998 RepID=UPI00111493BB|nr:hypothetical protein [Acidocella aminolytica]
MSALSGLVITGSRRGRLSRRAYDRYVLPIVWQHRLAHLTLLYGLIRQNLPPYGWVMRLGPVLAHRLVRFSLWFVPLSPRLSLAAAMLRPHVRERSLVQNNKKFLFSVIAPPGRQ